MSLPKPSDGKRIKDPTITKRLVSQIERATQKTISGEVEAFQLHDRRIIVRYRAGKKVHSRLFGSDEELTNID